jgi:hypothetical protein
VLSALTCETMTITTTITTTNRTFPRGT